MRRHSLAAVLTAAGLIAAPLAALGALTSSAHAAGSETWSLNSAMAADPVDNPIADTAGRPGVWSFYAGAGTNPSTYELLGPGVSATNCDTAGFYIHRPPSGGDLPQIGYNSSDNTADCGTPQTPPHTVHAHPYADRDAIFAWTSPITGTIEASGTITDDDGVSGNGVTYELLDQAGTHIIGDDVTNGSYSTFDAQDVSVTQGEVLYLHIGARAGDYGYDSTAVDFNITGTPSTPPAPLVVTKSSPRKGYQGQVKTLTVTGSGFTDSSRVTFDDATGLSVGDESVTPTKITVPVVIAADAPPTLRHVVVSDSSTESTATCAKATSCAFTVYPVPTISAVDPSSVQQGSTQTITLTGDQFYAGMTVKVSGTGVTVGDVEVVSPQEARFTLSVAPDARQGARNITVKDVGGGHSTAKKAVTITPATNNT